ncbi:MAG: hypothetical protein KDA94_07230, partial [Acidimicrobiales bacterium]|nr:hypothetical protein [Acidimicrobiales bacterium]
MEMHEAVNRAESLRELISDNAATGEADRRVAQDVIDAVADARLFEVAVPTSLGGHGLGIDALAEVTRTMGRA